MDEPRRYRTRSAAKAQVDPSASTTSTTSSTRSSTRSASSSSTSSATTKAKTSTGRRGRPKKSDIVNELASAPAETGTSSKLKSSVKKSSSTGSKKVAFVESDVKDKENYCPSEDDLVCVTSKRTRSTASSVSSSSSTGLRKQATVGRRKQPLAETSEPEVANKAPATTRRGAPKRRVPAAKASTLDSSRARRAPASKSMEEPARRPVDPMDEIVAEPISGASLLQTPAKRPPTSGTLLEGSTIRVASTLTMQTPAKRPLLTSSIIEEKEEGKEEKQVKFSMLHTPAKRPPPSSQKVMEKINATPFRPTSMQTPAKRPLPSSSHNNEQSERSRQGSPPKRVRSEEFSPEKIMEDAPVISMSIAKRPPPGSNPIIKTPFKQAPQSAKKPTAAPSGLSTPARRPPTSGLFSTSKLQSQQQSQQSNPFAAPKTVQQPPRRIVGLDVAAFPKTCVKPSNKEDNSNNNNKMSFLQTPMRRPNMGLQKIPEKEEDNKTSAPKSLMKSPRRPEQKPTTTPSPVKRAMSITPSPEKREVRIYTPVPVKDDPSNVAEKFSDMNFNTVKPVPTLKFGQKSALTTPKAEEQAPKATIPATAPPKAFLPTATSAVAAIPKTPIAQSSGTLAIYEDEDAEHEIIDENENELSVPKAASFELFSDEMDVDGDLSMNDDGDEFQAIELQSPTPASRRQSGIFAHVSPRSSPTRNSPTKEAVADHGPITPPQPKNNLPEMAFFSSPANVISIDDSSDDEEMDENLAPTLQYFNQQFAIDPRLMDNTAPRNIPGSTMKIALKPPADDTPVKRVAADGFGPITLRPSVGRPSTGATPSKTPKSSRKSISGPLSGATIYVDARTMEGYDASSSFATSLSSLGAKCIKQWTWNPSKRDQGFGAPDLDEVGITHVVFKDGSPTTLKKVKETQGLVLCVGVSWAMECEKQQRWVDEDAFLYDLDFVPRGGQRRRKSMEPKALASSNNITKTPAKENSFTPSKPSTTTKSSYKQENDENDFSFFSKPLAPMPPSTPLPTKIGLALTMSQGGPKTCPPKDKNYYFELENNSYLQKNLLEARRKSLQFKPKISSPLRRSTFFGSDDSF